MVSRHEDNSIVRVEALVSSAEYANVSPGARIQVIFVTDPQQIFPAVSGEIVGLSGHDAHVVEAGEEFVRLEIAVPIRDIAAACEGLEAEPASARLTLPVRARLVLGQVV